MTIKLKHAANYRAWAIGQQQRNGFQVRKVVWGLVMANAEKRPGEEIRRAFVLVGPTRKRKPSAPIVRRALKELEAQMPFPW